MNDENATSMGEQALPGSAPPDMAGDTPADFDIDPQSQPDPMTEVEPEPGPGGATGAFEPDEIVGSAGAPFSEDRVVLRGLLGPRVQSGEGAFYRLFASTSLDRWLQIPEAALKSRFKSEGGSFVWVVRDARLLECHQARACHFAEPGSAFDVDPTSSPAGRYPRYG